AGIRIARLEQDLPHADERRIFDVVASGLQGVGELLTEYRLLANGIEFTDAINTRMGVLQHKIEERDGWRLQQQVEEILSRLEFPAGRYMQELSGGWRRRVALAKRWCSRRMFCCLTNLLTI